MAPLTKSPFCLTFFLITNRELAKNNRSMNFVDHFHVGTMAMVLPAAQDLIHITMRGHYYRVVGNGQLRLSPWATYTKQPLRKICVSIWPTDPKTGDSSFLSHSWWPSALPTSYYNYYERFVPGFGTDLSMSNIITLLCTIAACSDERHHQLLHPQFIIFRHHTQQSDIISPY